MSAARRARHIDGQMPLFDADKAWNTTPAPRPFTYYLGGRPSWLGDPAFADVPLMVAAPTLDRYRGSGWSKKAGVEPDVPDTARRWGRWFGDSGAYIALTGSGTNRGEAHPWHFDEEEFAGFWTRVIDDFGRPDFVSPQDMPCEPAALARTGLTVRDHIELTVDNFVRLREIAPWVPWVPVLQGWEPEDYLYAVECYERAGVDLAAEPLVGVGSICRRGSVPGIVRVLETLAGRGYRLHGFGVKTEALPLIGHLLASADSYAWSDTARHGRTLLEGCRHVTRQCATSHGPDCGEHLTDCRNCGRWAREWRRRVLARLPRQATHALAA
jgi:hypothetical protein